MDTTLQLWAVPLAITLHNLEEAVWLPGWSQQAGRFRRPVEAGPFRFAAAALTLAAFLAAAWAQLGGPGSTGHYVLAAYALGQSLNVFVPHLAVALAGRAYAPGLLSGLVFVLPAAGAFLYRSFAAGQLDGGRFLVTAALVLPLLLASIPVLLHTGAAVDRLRPAPRP